MKAQKILITIIIFFAITLIGAGAFYTLYEPPAKEYKENRTYKTVTTQPENTIADSALTKEDFGKTAKDIGFETVDCQKTFCIATHDTYDEKDYKDSITVEQDPEGNKMFIIELYFHKNDYNRENIHKHLNNIVPNFAGTKVTEEQLKELEDIYKQGKREQASKTYPVGLYTMELLIKKVPDTDFYKVRFRFVSTSLYNIK